MVKNLGILWDECIILLMKFKKKNVSILFKNMTSNQCIWEQIEISESLDIKKVLWFEKWKNK